MDHELFIKLFFHSPAIYPFHMDMYCINGYYLNQPQLSKKEISVEEVIEPTIEAALWKVAQQICNQSNVKMPKDFGSTRGWSDKALKIDADGRTITFSPADADLIEDLQKLPANEKIAIMNLSDEEMEAVISNAKTAAKNKIKTLLSKKWKYRETGDLLRMDDLIDKDYSLKSISDMMKKRTTTIEDYNTVLELFEGSNSWIYSE